MTNEPTAVGTWMASVHAERDAALARVAELKKALRHVKTIITRRMEICERGIKECQRSIQESYARGQTNVDARRTQILRWEQQKAALEDALDEIEYEAQKVLKPEEAK